MPCLAFAQCFLGPLTLGDVPAIDVDVFFVGRRRDRQGDDAVVAVELVLHGFTVTRDLGAHRDEFGRQLRLLAPGQEPRDRERSVVGIEHVSVGHDPEYRVRVFGREPGEMGELLMGEIGIARLRLHRRAASIGGLDGGGALFERIDLVDQMRLRHAKAALPERGCIRHGASPRKPSKTKGIHEQRRYHTLSMPAKLGVRFARGAVTSSVAERHLGYSAA